MADPLLQLLEILQQGRYVDLAIMFGSDPQRRFEQRRWRAVQAIKKGLARFHQTLRAMLPF
ncbi:hypothetical protein D3C78_1691020 [compost metagenome]